MAESRNIPTDRPTGHSTQRPLRVVIVDDRGPARQGLEALLSLRDDLTVAGVATDGKGAIALATDCKPDVVLMDARMPGMSGFEAAWEIKRHSPGVRVVVTSMYPASRNDPFIEAADQFLLKGFGVEQLCDAIFGGREQTPAPAPGAKRG